MLGALTVIGRVINRLSPNALQRARLDGIDAPLRLIPPLPGTDVKDVALPHCPAEWVISPQARESTSLIVYFHDSALVTLGLNSHRRFVSSLSAATGAKVFNVGYRLAPQASIDDAVADGLDAYRQVLSQGFAPSASCWPVTRRADCWPPTLPSRRGTRGCRCRKGRRRCHR